MRKGKVVLNLIFRGLRYSDGIIECDHRYLQTVTDADKVQLRVAKINLSLGHVKLRFGPDLVEGLGLLQVLLKLFHCLPCDHQVPLCLKHLIIGLLDIQDDLVLSVQQVCLCRICIQFLDIHLGACLPEVKDRLRCVYACVNTDQRNVRTN